MTKKTNETFPPGWARYYTAEWNDNGSGINIEFYRYAHEAIKHASHISQLTCKLSTEDVLQQMREKPLSDRIEEPPKRYKPGRHSISINKYSREIKPGVWVDVYDVLRAFNVTCGAVAHAVKKLLALGQRGVKDERQDIKEARQSLERGEQIMDEWA